MARAEHDDATDKWLRPLIGLVAFLAATAVVVSAGTVLFLPAAHPGITVLAALVLLTAGANQFGVRFRIRAVSQGFTWTDAAAVISLAVAPTAWAVLCTAVGVTLSRLLTRTDPVKFVFGVAKATLTVAAGGLTLMALGSPALTTSSPLRILCVFAAVHLVVAVVDELVAIPVIALATGTRIRHHVRTHWDIRLTSLMARFAVVISVLLLVRAGSMLLVAVPPLVLSLHLASSSRLRGQAERAAWQELAQTTDEFNVIELDAVLRSAVTRAAQLFSADEAEVELHGPGARLVRASSEGIGYDGVPAAAPERDDTVIPASLEGRDGSAHIGVLRLRFRRPVTLSELERYKLSTFASALCTAVRNASAYAELERIAAENAVAATHDPLTGLGNRRALLDRGAELLVERRADGMTALLLIDLNHFKEVNDTLGHAAGDQVLCAVAERLAAAVRPTDLVARLGGDEFAVLLRGLPAPAVATHRADMLLAAVHQSIEVDGMRITVDGCGGIAFAAGAGGMAELLRRADVAMYQAKRSGQRLVSYSHARDTADVGRLALGGELPRAVAEREFTVEFQPIVDLSTGQVVAAEALARWRHPDHGNLNPMLFLEAVERSGMLPAFADTVLDQSLTAVGTWRDAGFDLPVAVNVSARSLLDPQFPESVLTRLQAHDVPPGRLYLELTETLTISQLEVVDQVLGELRDAGVRLALDDFGTGYSSLSVLSRIPVHELKIDRDFVMKMDTSPEAAAVIRSTVDLGRSLDLVVVAEGVESEPQRRALWEMGCVAGQGHLFARPMPAPRLLAALHRGCGGRPGTLAPPLHDAGAVIRLSPARRAGGRAREDRLPHLPA